MSKSYDAKQDRELVERKRTIDNERRAQAILKRQARDRATAQTMAVIARAAVRAS